MREHTDRVLGSVLTKHSPKHASFHIQVERPGRADILLGRHESSNTCAPSPCKNVGPTSRSPDPNPHRDAERFSRSSSYCAPR